jgi:hypothetical protein
MELETTETTEELITFTMEEAEIAVRFYRKHLKRTCAYQKLHPEICKVKNKRWYDKQKLENPEKYEEMLIKSRDYGKKRRQKKLDLEQVKAT